MDVYICTENVRLGRALALEAQDAGFSAAFGQDPTDAQLVVRDLDSGAGVAEPSDAVCFSREEERLRAAVRHGGGGNTAFLLYPFDLAVFRAQLAAQGIEREPYVRSLTLNTANRRVSGAGGELRLSVHECAMLEKLGGGGCLSRADAAALFGSATGNVVDVYVCYLRKKLGRLLPGEIIRSLRGKGYALSDTVTLEVL